MTTDTTTLIAAMRILAADIQSDDGVANLAIAEAADRLEELEAALQHLCDAVYGVCDFGDGTAVHGAMLRAEKLLAKGKPRVELK